ncbi:MAG: glycosyl hydrolase 115 family protein [Bacteroidaceae bacterium]|nr:glycosyl hydrolase 115 family protein [Bacteroidaceae bacterium]
MTIFILSLAGTLQAAADLTFSQVASGFPIVGTDANAVFVVDANDAEVVTTAARCVIRDIKAVTGTSLTLRNLTFSPNLPYSLPLPLQRKGEPLREGGGDNSPQFTPPLEGMGEAVILAGTIGSSALIDALIADGKVDTTGLTGVWEAYALQLVQEPMEGVGQALVVLGGTPRGTAYGLFEISRRIGVSPYVWWADVEPAPMACIYVQGDRTDVEKPSVRYRGLFINDEDWALLPWAKRTIDATYNNIGPNTYEKVMELLLRLRANCLWPAKHGSSRAFWSMEENKRLAKAWAIVMSSGDSMLRDNLWEWPRFKSGNNSNNFTFATNPQGCYDYWAKRAGEARDYEGIYDIGMRGLQDVALLGYDGQAAQLKGLADIIAAQREIITDSLGGDPTKVPQIYIPYKEALTLYNAGLQIPDDVTMCWVDDNYAYIRQLPTAKERKRSGGHGIYYHLSYLGNPCSYIWLSTISPSLISYELSKAYENGMTRFWMINVGDIKPAEAEFEFCMELAWDVSKWTPERAHEFSRWWSAKTFGEEFADEMGEMRLEHYRLASASKPECVYHVSLTIPEMQQRIKDYQTLAARVRSLQESIPQRLQDAYFELFAYPILAAAGQNLKAYGAKLSYWYAGLGDHARAMHYAALARSGYSDVVYLTDIFNNQTAGGKWNGMMNKSPNASTTGPQFGMPYAATSSEVNDAKGEVFDEGYVYLPGTSYTGSRGTWQTLENLGVGGQSITVWPIDYTTYTATNARSKAPYVEYSLPLEKGKYQIIVRCLPTFPITTAHDLCVGMGIGAGSVTSQSIKCNAETNVWSDNVMHGYAEARFSYTATSAKDVAFRFYALNPALVISQIVYRRTDAEDLTLTDQLLVNPDFELYKSGGSVRTNPTGGIQRGVPYGWTLEGTMSGNSYGISNSDGSINYCEGGSICWFKAKPMPENFRLYQTIPADKLQPGVYEVGCWLFNQSGKRGPCRLFANDHVQYYAHKSDYDQILKADEVSSFAGHKAGYETHTIMHPMRVVLQVHEGEGLTVGIKTSCISNDGRQTDETGWFKVDHFTVRRIGDLPQGDPDSLTRALIVNSDFEYKTETELANGATVKGVPYGWSVSYTGTYTMTNSGLYGRGEGMHGQNYCAFTPAGYRPMPNDFCLYQTIPAAKLQAGIYRISCLFWSETGLEGMGRLFANNAVQYYGSSHAYEQNLTPGETNSFASYISEAVDGKSMQELSVEVTVAEGEDLTLGIRSGSIKGDGTQVTGQNRTGKFRVDYFRIERLMDANPDGIALVHEDDRFYRHYQARGTTYNLSGQAVKAGRPNGQLPKGIYIRNGRKVVVK